MVMAWTRSVLYTSRATLVRQTAQTSSLLVHANNGAVDMCTCSYRALFYGLLTLLELP